MEKLNSYYNFENSNKLILVGKKPPKTILVVLSLIILIGLLAPIVATYFALKNGVQIKPTIIFSYIIFWGISLYVFKILSWNYSGKEYYEFNRNEIRYLAITNFMKLKDQKIIFDKPLATIYPSGSRRIKNEEISFGRLIIKDSKNKIESELKIPTKILQKIQRKINQNYA